MNDARIRVGSYRHHNGDRPHFWCAVCGYDTDNDQTMVTHVKRRHPGIPEVSPQQIAVEQRSDELREYTVNELTEKAESLGMTVSGLRKQEIIDAIQTTESLGEPDEY